MYSKYFGLKEKPFSIAANPKFLYMSELHREALAHLLYGISSEGCIILLTGDVGTGKTTLYRSMIEQLPAETKIAIVLNPQLGIADIFKTICDEFSIQISNGSTSLKSYIDSINEFLLDTHARGQNTAVIIDEAQNLDKEVLEHLRLLTNLETNTNKLLQIVLVGQPQLKKMLNDPELSQINQRVTARYHLSPLEQKDVFKYIEHRLAIAAGGRSAHSLFTPKAVRIIARKSRGIPRLINLLCDRSLLGAYVENRHQVDHHIVKKAVKEIISPESTRTKIKKKFLVLSVLILLLSLPLLGGLYYFGNYRPAFENSRLSDLVNVVRGGSSSQVTEKIEPEPLPVPSD